ncbi:hypothetical protein Tco_0574561, partial [Tanacetum coccineum]
MVEVSVLFRLWKTCLERVSWTSEEVGMFIFRCAPFEALYGRKCSSLIIWAEVGE